MEEKKTGSHAEIDLIYFFRPIKNIIEKVSNVITGYFSLLKRKKNIFYSIFIIIGLVGLSLKYIIPPAYQVSGVFVSQMMRNTYCKMMIEQLRISEKNLPILSEQLGISTWAASRIRSVTLEPIIEGFAINVRDTAYSPFRITLILNDMQSVDTIQQGIVNYLEKSEYAQKRKEAKTKALLLKKKGYIDRIRSLDSVKVLVQKSIIPRSEGHGIILGEPIDPVNIYNTEASYYNEIAAIDEQLQTMDNIEVIQPITKTNTYNYPNYNKLFLYGLLAALCIAAILTPIIGSVQDFFRNRISEKE